MDTTLRLWSLPVEEVRQFFSATPDEADHLRRVAATLMAPSQTPRGILSKIGPLTRKNPPMPVIAPGIPNRMDVEFLLTGRFVPNDRLSAAWAVVAAWLDDQALARADIHVDASNLDTYEFDLARAGVPYDVCIRRLWGRSLDIPLRPMPSMSAGYLPYSLVIALNDQWGEKAESLEDATRPFITDVMAFSSRIDEYEQAAAEAGRDYPDLVAMWML